MNHDKKLFCRHFDRCSGCQSDATLAFPPIWNDVLEFFLERSMFSVGFHDGSRLKWRNRAKLAVRGDKANPLIGLFKQGSHDVVPIPFCEIHYPEINQCIEIIRQQMMNHGLLPYAEHKNEGELRYLQFVVERGSRKVQVVFVLNFSDFSSPRAKKWKSILESLGNECNENLWHSLWINLNHHSTNTIFGSQWALCYGHEFLQEQFGHISLFYQPATFAQANPELFERMLFRIDQLIQPGSTIAEFYAGIGVIGLYLSRRARWVRCAEINSHAELCFSRTKNLLPGEDAQKISFHTGAASDLLRILDGANVAIVDPPRKGLDDQILNSLSIDSSLESLFYISCGWESFKRDCDKLLLVGWKLDVVDGYLFFPGSNHIEILAKFSR